MENYFDGFVYRANWETHEFQLALPVSLLLAETARQYCTGPAASAREKSGKLILNFRSEEESGGEWVQGEGLLSSLLPFRAELAQGDLRILYVGWLLSGQAGEPEEEATEPPLPPNLGESSRPLSKLVDCLRIDRDLLAVAAEASPRRSGDQARALAAVRGLDYVRFLPKTAGRGASLTCGCRDLLAVLRFSVPSSSTARATNSH